jgi:hypothetical protein
MISHSETRKEVQMTKEERVEKTAADFSSLTGQNQDYVLGIMQALFFAKNALAPVQIDCEMVGEREQDIILG